jgi:hypothetical protein
MNRIQRGIRNAMYVYGVSIGYVSRGKQKNPFPINATHLKQALKGVEIPIEQEAKLLDFLQENKYI